MTNVKTLSAAWRLRGRRHLRLAALYNDAQSFDYLSTQVLREGFIVKKIIVALLMLPIYGCDSPDMNYNGLNATLWMQSSAEYVASAEQAFNAARMNLDKALRDKNWTAALEQNGAYKDLPPAVIFDVDETVLDNSPYQGYLIKSGQAYHGETWRDWVTAARAEPIKGVKALIAEIKSQGIDVFYVTNRDASHDAAEDVKVKDATVKNIKATVDADVQANQVLCKGERKAWGSDKSSRRAEIAKTHRIIMMFGDNYNDFRFIENSPSAAARVADIQTYKTYWGSKWILISNPVYGHWERPIFNYARALPADEKLQAKLQYLKADSGAPADAS